MLVFSYCTISNLSLCADHAHRGQSQFGRGLLDDTNIARSNDSESDGDYILTSNVSTGRFGG